MRDQRKKVVAVVGPTASGKSALAIDIALQFEGEVISVDSRQVYRGLDIGTGKVTQEEMRDVPHHLLDVSDPHTVYTAADFERDASAAIKGILDRGRLPVLAGGTFFYLDLLRGKMATAPVLPNPEFRQELEGKTTEELFLRLQQADPRRAETVDERNRRRLIRSLEIIKEIGVVPPMLQQDHEYTWLLVGIDIGKETLHSQIHNRLHSRLQDGMLDEAKRLHESGLSYERMEELGLEYRYLGKHLQGLLTYEEMTAELEAKIRQYAKRQMTWLKRDETIEWHEPENRSAIFRRVESFLTTEYSF